MPYSNTKGRLKTPKFRKALLKRLFPTTAKASSSSYVHPKSAGRVAPRMKSSVNQRTSGFVGAAGDAKYIDVAGATYVNDTTGTITHLDVVAQGTTVNQREGKAFRPTSCLIRGKIYNGADSTFNLAANYLVWDRQPNKAKAAILDVLETADSASFARRENAARFVILRRFSYPLMGESDNKASSGNYCIGINEYVKLPPDCIAQCTTADTTGAIGNRVSGALLFLTTGDHAAGTSAATSALEFRINFVDV